MSAEARHLKIPGAMWVPDGDATSCMMEERCADRRPFSLFNRRHHCRWCGKVFCDACAPVREGGQRKCRICFFPMIFMPCRFPVFIKRAAAVGAGGGAAGGASSAPPSPPGSGGIVAGAGDDNPFEVENRNLRGTNGYFVLGKFSGSVCETIMSFLEFGQLNALLQTCKKAQSHFHVRGLRYEASITDRFPNYWAQARIGDGGGGVVFKVADPSAPAGAQPFVALKVVKKSAQYGFAVWKRLRTEIDLQLAINHPNIAKLLDVFQTPDEVVLVIEAGDGGSLRKVFELLRSSHQHISWFTAHCLHGCAQALVHLRELNIAHRDIKCDNIVLSDDFSRVMMIDFGLAEKVTSSRQPFTPCGTVGFASPENIAAVAERRNKFQADIATMHKADMFSMGVVAFMMLSSTKPFKGSRFPEMHREVQQGLRCEGRGWGHVGSAAKLLVERLLRGDAATRASAEDCINDPWVNEGCRRFTEVITRRRDDLQRQRAQLSDEWDMPTIERAARAGGGASATETTDTPSSATSGTEDSGNGFDDDVWTIEGEVMDPAGGQFRAVS